MGGFMNRPLEQDYTSLTAYTRALEEYCDALAQPEQKPMHPELRKMLEDYFDKCFAESAPQRTWVGLTRDEQSFVYSSLHNSTSRKDSFWVDFANAIEAELKAKNI